MIAAYTYNYYERSNTSAWPALNYAELKNTIATVHMWAQIIGKIRLVKTPWINHSWHVTLFVSATGLTTGSIPFERGIFESTSRPMKEERTTPK